MAPELDAILENREAIYGAPALNFGRTAALLNVVLENKLRARLSASDVGLIAICIKLGRLIQTPDHQDTILDIQGYARCLQQLTGDSR